MYGLRIVLPRKLSPSRRPPQSPNQSNILSVLRFITLTSGFSVIDIAAKYLALPKIFLSFYNTISEYGVRRD